MMAGTTAWTMVKTAIRTLFFAKTGWVIAHPAQLQV